MKKITTQEVKDFKGDLFEAVQLDRDNFYAVGKFANADRCWGLKAPSPRLHVATPGDVFSCLLGDWVLKSGNGHVFFLKDEDYRRLFEEDINHG